MHSPRISPMGHELSFHGVQGTALRMLFRRRLRHGRSARATDNPASTAVSRPDEQPELFARIDAIVRLGTMGA